MNCIIPGPNVKVVAKALHALAKIGDDLYIEAKAEKISLIALSLSRIVCVGYYFHDNFFTSYEITENNNAKAVTCKILMKTLLPLFKGTHFDKKLDYIKLEYEQDSDYIIFKMKYKCDDIIMIHKLKLMEAESISVDISTSSGSNNMCATSSLYNQLLNTFSNSDNEITLEISKQKVVARNYCLGAPVHLKSVRSQVNLIGSEFNIFEIQNETSINFSLKPLRTAIQFAEAFNLSIGLNFEKGGRPLVLVLKNPTFEVNFIIATLDPYSDPQSSMTSSPIATKITQHSENILPVDHTAQENWEDMGIEINHQPKKKPRKSSFQEIMEKAKSSNKKQPNCDKNDSSPKRQHVFSLPWESPNRIESEEVVPRSPESPNTSKAKLVFGRCFESTFSRDNFGEVLAPNSDSE